MTIFVTGRLSMTFPRNVGQVPIYYSMKSTGRPHIPFRKYRTGYIDCPLDPLYPFGYGLSYSTVDYSDMTASYDAGDKTVKASVKVTNVSDRAVTETVHLYDKFGIDGIPSYVLVDRSGKYELRNDFRDHG